MEKKNSIFYFLATFLVFGFFGTQLMKNSWDGVVYFFPSKNLRTPAAIHKTYDFSTLDGQALATASKKRLVENVKIKKLKDTVLVELGNFVQKGHMGRKQFACSTYKSVVLTFVAEGVTVGGEAPLLKIIGPCKVSQKLSRLKPIVVPFKEIFKNKPGNYEFNFWDLNNTKAVTLNIPSAWPKNWILKEVGLLGDSQNIFVSSKELASFTSENTKVRF